MCMIVMDLDYPEGVSLLNTTAMRPVALSEKAG